MTLDALTAHLTAAADTIGAAGIELDHANTPSLPDTLTAIATVDQLAHDLAALRDRLEAAAATSPIWRRNRAAWPELGIRAERSRTTRRRWDLPRLVGRLAPHLRVNRETGELDILADDRTVELIGRRLLEYVSASAARLTPLRDLDIPYEDLVEEEAGTWRVRVYREAPAPAEDVAGAA